MSKQAHENDDRRVHMIVWYHAIFNVIIALVMHQQVETFYLTEFLESKYIFGMHYNCWHWLELSENYLPDFSILAPDE